MPDELTASVNSCTMKAEPLWGLSTWTFYMARGGHRMVSGANVEDMIKWEHLRTDFTNRDLMNSDQYVYFNKSRFLQDYTQPAHL